MASDSAAVSAASDVERLTVMAALDLAAETAESSGGSIGHIRFIARINGNGIGCIRW